MNRAQSFRIDYILLVSFVCCVYCFNRSSDLIATSSERIAKFAIKKFCPPAELIRPCKCQEYHVGQFLQTLLACNNTDFKFERSFEPTLHRISKRLGPNRSKYFDWLYLTNLKARKLSRNFFAGLRFKYLVIENAPMLKSIHQSALKLVTNTLRYIYAYNTGLESYRWHPMTTPLNLMKNLTEVHVASEQNVCPPKGMLTECSAVFYSVH